MRRPRRSEVCLALAAAVLAGCASMRPLEPAAAPLELAEGEGILVLHVRTEYPLQSVRASSAAIAEDLPAGEHLLLLAAPAGTYRWDGIERKIGDRTWWYRFILPDGRSRFTVEAGRINYPGQLVIWRPDPVHGYGLSFHDERLLGLRIVNRSARLFESFLARHAELLARFPMRYSGFGRDEFLERYLEARRRLSDAADTGSSPP